ncbi:MAG: magnesium chelatase ATPase subunit I [Alphaproteobacteria bacterium]|nr:magnesium chelatase ATPase subunit I [Alphaproteobacteria bacterium]
MLEFEDPSRQSVSGREARQRLFPFSAIVGQADMKLALLLAAVEPSIGGVLVMGDRGTGKSTCVRGLAALLPHVRVVDGCPYRCDPEQLAGQCRRCREAETKVEWHHEAVPVVDLPIGATEDRIVGALDVEQALLFGKKQFEPGLLAKAHRGFLYIDEINLLDDHLVDLLLDVAASGENLVEREGLSIRHPARFVLVGSGNPEEGELRPQLLDRFGLCVDVESTTDIESRIAAVKRRDAFERDGAAFLTEWAEAEQDDRDRIVHGRRILDSVKVPDEMIELAARLCLALGADGLRGELTMIRAARSMAALEDVLLVEKRHILTVCPMTLAHRLRKDPLDEASSKARIERAIAEVSAQ